MKVVGLVSGGKDSCYNLLKCIENGHEVICLANLHPSINGMDEIDSYMYQCVAYTGVQLYSEACELPLYRREIRGRPIETRPVYEPTVDDEVEDLYELLLDVKRRHSNIEAVSSGAILSSYQKNRIQNVCKRLDLQSLTYLWDANQAALLDEMISHGIEAIIVKVAALGLTKEHLNKSLSQMRSILLELNSRYGINICGEGGEYETFVVDCPLFKKRIVIEETKIVEDSINDVAPVAYLSLCKLHLEDK